MATHDPFEALDALERLLRAAPHADRCGTRAPRAFGPVQGPAPVCDCWRKEAEARLLDARAGARKLEERAKARDKRADDARLSEIESAVERGRRRGYAEAKKEIAEGEDKARTARIEAAVASDPSLRRALAVVEALHEQKITDDGAVASIVASVLAIPPST